MQQSVWQYLHAYADMKVSFTTLRTILPTKITYWIYQESLIFTEVDYRQGRGWVFTTMFSLWCAYSPIPYLQRRFVQTNLSKPHVHRSLTLIITGSVATLQLTSGRVMLWLQLIDSQAVSKNLSQSFFVFSHTYRASAATWFNSKQHRESPICHRWLPWQLTVLVRSLSNIFSKHTLNWQYHRHVRGQSYGMAEWLHPIFLSGSSHWSMASYQIRKIAGWACAGNAGNIFPTTDFKGNL